MKTLHRRGVLFIFSVMLLTSCSSGPEAPPAPSATTSPSAPAYHPPAISTPAAPPAIYKPMADDQCGASQLQYLVGKPRTDIPVPLDPGSRRVVCSTCIVTMEYRADRQTIVFNTDTGIIESVKCG